MISNSAIQQRAPQPGSPSVQFGMAPKPKSPESGSQSLEDGTSKEDAFSRQPSSSDDDQQETSSLTGQKERLEQKYNSLSRDIKSIESKFKQSTVSTQSVIEALTCAMREQCRLDKQIQQLKQTIQRQEETRHFKAELDALKASKSLDQFNAESSSPSSSRAGRLLQTALKFDNPEAIENLHQKGYFETDRKAEEAAFLFVRQNFPKRHPLTAIIDTTKIGPDTLLHAVEQDAEKCFAKMLELGVALEESFYAPIIAEVGDMKRFQNVAMLLKKRVEHFNPNVPWVGTASSPFNEKKNLYQKYLDRLPQ
ncbi:hypothetical protein [Vampirovibrio chlorellavorus]|uniref:hypothetical protein n=1 Tax=Vampirovibrio chlorellavorus TaxID=758823 RepID=UPI0026EBD05A|nr:hypothetical protein [Vampirovibrio chlorellavorus]